MRLCVIVLPVAVLVHACAPSKPKPPDAVSSTEELAHYVESILETGDPPAVSVVVVDDVGPLYQRGFGWADEPRKRGATEQTVYQWWSISKILTAVSVLQLVEAGKLSLDAPVEQYLEFFQPKHGEDYAPVTVRQLLSHSACLNDVGMKILGWVHFRAEENVPQLEFAEMKLGEHGKLVCEPGSQGRYSNLGYIVLAALIEKQSGQRYEDYVREHIFTPLGMKHSDFVYTVAMAPHEAAGSHPKNLMSWFAFKFFLPEEKATRALVDDRYWFRHLYSDQKGSTGAIGSAADLGRFATALLRGGELDGVRILGSQSVASMSEPVLEVRKGGRKRGMRFGLGWFVEGEGAERVLSHGGGGMAFRAMLQLHPGRKLGVAVLANSTYLDGAGGAHVAEAAAAAVPARSDTR